MKAQIKLKFRNTRQQAMVVTRSMQLTQTKTKTTLKTLESLLSTVDPKTGEQVSISSRCAQLDSEMPFHLGVSKAVLQNVIFCHQVSDRDNILYDSNILSLIGRVDVAVKRVVGSQEAVRRDFRC